MIVIAGVVLGAIFGAMSAKKRNGSRGDLWQYGTVFAIIGGLAGLILTIVIEKLVF